MTIDISIITGITIVGILGAFRQGKGRGQDMFDNWWKGPPEFTEKDNKAAREEGFFDALDRWRWIVGGKEADLGREKIKRMTKAQVGADLESEGVPFDELGEMSDEAIHLPLHPDYAAEHRIHVPKNKYEQDAHIMGMCNRLIHIKERLAKYGISLEMAPDEVPDKHRDIYQWGRGEYATLAERLEAFGEDIDAIERDIDTGDIQRQDFVDAPSDEEVLADQSHTTASAVNTYGQSQKQTTTDYPRDSGGVGSANRGASSQSSPTVHLKEHELAMMRERLGEINDMMRDLGYDLDSELDKVSSRDRAVVRPLIYERDTIAKDLATLCEDIEEVKNELYEQRNTDSLEDDSEMNNNASANNSDDDASNEMSQEESSRSSDQGEGDDSSADSSDGWDGMFEGFESGE